jgi:TRAP-type mannitol/chloroaromatic compound transport system substrate-binding protein
MKRRAFLTASATSVAGLGLAKPAIAQSTPETTWRLTSAFPSSAETILGAAHEMARYVSTVTDGKFKIRIFPVGSAIAPDKAFDAVTTGSFECMQTPLYALAGKEPTFAIGTGIPFGLNARHQQSWWQAGGGREIIGKELEKLNLVGLVMGNSGTQMGGWFRNEIRTVDDLKGLKFRIGGMGGDILAKLGVVKMATPISEVRAALGNGTLDAVEFVGPSDDEKLALYNVAKNYYCPGWWEGGAMLHLLVNRNAWNDLPPSYRAALEAAGEAANNWMLSQYDRNNPAALKRLVAHGVTVRSFPKPVIDACWTAAQDHYATLSASNPVFKEALDSYTTFRVEALSYWRVAEYAYDAMLMDYVRG